MNTFDFSNAVTRFAMGGQARFHMPGHKGRPLGSPLDPVLPYDVTELRDTDNLLCPEKCGSLEHTLACFREIYGTASTVFSAGGATAAIAATISAVIRARGKKVICDRSAHLSVIYALAHSGALPVWLYRDSSGAVDTIAAALALDHNPDASCIILTSPDYYGRMCNITAISDAAEKYGIPVIVDSAHGAHLPFYGDGSLSAYKCGASFVIESLHKTLPALTGAALLHSDGTLPEEMLLSQMRHFASSSPSYLISQSICSCVGFMHARGRSMLHDLECRIQSVKNRLCKLGYTFLDYADKQPKCDPFRLCIKQPIGKSPGSLYDFLYDNGVICEFFDRDFVVLIPSVMNTDGDFDKLCALCADFASLAIAEPYYPSPLPTIRPRIAISMNEALIDRKPLRVPLKAARGRICAEPQAPYPPGTAVIVPGEIYDGDVINYLSACGFDAVWIAE